MSVETVDVYPRRPIRAERVNGAPGRPAGWSTLVRRTWHSDEELAANWMPAEVWDELVAAARLVVGTWGPVGSTSPLERLERALRPFDG